MKNQRICVTENGQVWGFGTSEKQAIKSLMRQIDDIQMNSYHDNHGIFIEPEMTLRAYRAKRPKIEDYINVDLVEEVIDAMTNSYISWEDGTIPSHGNLPSPAWEKPGRYGGVFDLCDLTERFEKAIKQWVRAHKGKFSHQWVPCGKPLWNIHIVVDCHDDRYRWVYAAEGNEMHNRLNNLDDKENPGDMLCSLMVLGWSRSAWAEALAGTRILTTEEIEKVAHVFEVNPCFLTPDRG